MPQENAPITKVHCFFEQSGTFKGEFIKLGIPAEDYDIQNNFAQTDHVCDLFAEIERAWAGEKSLFDRIEHTDLIMAFFPCIYFEAMQMTNYSFDSINMKNMTPAQKYACVIERAENRSKYYLLLWKLFAVCEQRGLRLILENPAVQPHYLLFSQNFLRPTFIDGNRQARGDYFRKPTAYWFLNIDRTYGQSYQAPKKKKIINKSRPGSKAGLCSEERSLISPDYARNFICDFILGRPTALTHPSLF